MSAPRICCPTHGSSRTSPSCNGSRCPIGPRDLARQGYRRRAVANTRRLHRAGVPILAGTDAPLPGTANGVSLLSALDYLCEASLSPTAALAAASSVPARAFGLGDRGLVRPGYRADLVLVEGDVTTDVRQVREIVAIWKYGYPVDRSPTAGTDS